MLAALFVAFGVFTGILFGHFELSESLRDVLAVESAAFHATRARTLGKNITQAANQSFDRFYGHSRKSLFASGNRTQILKKHDGLWLSMRSQKETWFPAHTSHVFVSNYEKK